MGARALAAVTTTVVLAVFSATAIAGSTDSISHTLSFDTSDISIERIDDLEVVSLRGAATTFAVGEPELPLVYVRLALPDGKIAAGARATVRSSVELPGSHSVRPAQPEVPLSLTGPVPRTAPDPVVYASESLYPNSVCELLDNGNAGGVRVATVAVHPMQYRPAAGTLVLNRDIEVTVTLAAASRTFRAPGDRSAKAEAAAIRRLRTIVDNPDDLSRPALRGTRDDAVDYLIVTTASLASSFQPLADWKTQRGVAAEVVTTDWIYANYAGTDEAEQVRNCIIDYYENKGTTWVMLGGDEGIVPVRVVIAMTGDAGDEIRCDLYFSDLDGTWNADGDAKWGEVSQDNVDLYADVFVGRATVRNTTQADRFVNKLLTYEGAPTGDPLPTDYQKDILFLAEVLWTSPWTDGGICKDMIDDASISPEFDPITKLYETNGQLSKSNAISEMNEGKNVINHVGHANYYVLSIGSSSLYASDFDGLDNEPRYGLFYSIGCWSAAIDYDSIAEHWLTSAQAGVAFIGNSRFGWGSPGNPGGGTSDRFDRVFFEKLYDEGLDRVGVAHAAHKDEFAAEAQYDSYTRYVLYQLNLLGDPEMRVWMDEPVLASVRHPSSISLGAQTLLVTVARDDAPAPDVDVFLVNDEISAVESTGPDGIATFALSPSTAGTLTLTITGPGIMPYSSSIVVSSDPPDTTPPLPIDFLTLADPFDLGGHILVDWTGFAPPSDFACYKVYRASAPFSSIGGRTPLATGLISASTTDWDDSTVVDGQTYHYAVTAVDFSGNEDASVTSFGPIAASVNSKILLWDADDGDLLFDGVSDDYTTADGTEVPWIEALDSIGRLYTYSETLPADLEPFEFIIYLGGAALFDGEGLNIPLTDDEATALTDFVDAGGCLYIEEPNFGHKYGLLGSPAGLELWSRFHATFVRGAKMDDGNVQSFSGESGTITEGMAFSYDYQGRSDQFTNEIAPNGDPGGELLWEDQSGLDRGAVYEDGATGSRRYMLPLILGAWTEGSHPSTRLEYVSRLLDDTGLLNGTGVDDGLAAKHSLRQNVPNPFNPVTTVSYSVGREGAPVDLAVYDVAGRLVKRLATGPHAAGEHAVSWDGRNDSGSRVASGIYFYRIAVDGWEESRKMVLLK